MARESLAEFVREYAARGDETCVVYRRGYRTERWTYRRVAEEAYRFARELEFRGIGKGDAVLLWGPASGEWIAAFLGCIVRGAVAVPLDPGSTTEFVSRIAGEANGRLLVHAQQAVTRGISIPTLALESLVESIASRSCDDYASPGLSRNDALEIIFTSGTTAEPRGVVISHGNVLANIEPIEAGIRKYLFYERFFHPLRFLNLLPQSHIFGQLMGVFIPALLGATTVFMESPKPSELLESIRRERISVVVGVPRFLESLQREIGRRMETAGDAEKFRQSFDAAKNEHFLRRWWRFREIHSRLGWKFWAFISGGAALPAGVETFWNRLGYAVIQGYGMTETTSLISLNHPLQSRRGSIGQAFPGMEVRVGEDGEILVRGANIASRYQRGGPEQPVMGEDGWFHTGDLAEVGEDGRLYFKGRRKSVIVTPAGMNVYPEDLEAALRAQPGIKDCVVIGIERDGNAEPCAVLLPRNAAADPARIVAAANNGLGEYQQIRDWFVWPDADFPRTATQKPVLQRIQEVANSRKRGGAMRAGNSLATIVEQITGRHIDGWSGSEAGLESQLNLSSIDRVELMGALEERYQIDLNETAFSQATTLERLEELLRKPQEATSEYVYPRWPQSRIATAIRLAIYYLLTWPATYLLAAPRVRGRENLGGVQGPVIVACNHVVYLDIGWVLAALPARFRHRLATAMDGELLNAMREAPKTRNGVSRMYERVRYFLVVTLFNVFALPRRSGFQKAFSFAGDLVDRGWNILIFPEGITSVNGQLAAFRSGIGLLATRLGIPVVPMRLDGVFELKKWKRWRVRPGQVRVAIGKPMRFRPEQSPEEIARELRECIAKLGSDVVRG